MSKIDLKPTRVVIVRWHAERGRSYTHVDDGKAMCKTCGYEWSEPCAVAKHTRKRKIKTTVTELAPREAKRVSQLYANLYSTFHGIGHGVGNSVYLVPADTDIDGVCKTLDATFAEANAGFTACKAAYDVKIVDVDPVSAHASTLASIRGDVESSIATLIETLRDGTDPTKLRAAVRETRNLAKIVDDASARRVGDLQLYLVKVAERLREAADHGQGAVEVVVQDARSSAARFAAMFQDDPEAGSSETAVGTEKLDTPSVTA